MASADRIRKAAHHLAGHIDAIPIFRNDPELAAAAREIVAAGAEHLGAIRFEFDVPRCKVNGVPIAHGSRKALSLAWLVLAGHQRRVGELRAEWVYPGSRADGNATQALKRIAEVCERYSPVLASAIGQIGAEGGRLVVKKKDLGIVCTVSPAVQDVISA
jgi:hypothetical protein